MIRRAGLLWMLLLLVGVAAACGSSDATPAPGTPAAAAPTSAAQPTAIPSVTPIGLSGSVAVYGSVQSDQLGQEVAQGVDAGAPLFFSAQSSENVTPQANATAIPLGATLAPTQTPLPGSQGVITIPPVQDDGPIFNIINSLCIPLINFVLNATIGVVLWAWNTVGAQGGLLWQALLCIAPPLLFGWYFLFFRRRRRRRNRD